MSVDYRRVLREMLDEFRRRVASADELPNSYRRGHFDGFCEGVETALRLLPEECPDCGEDAHPGLGCVRPWVHR